MARVGPNQDVNDPTTIIDLAYKFQQSSDVFGNFLAQSNAKDKNVISGPPIFDVVIPFKIQDGSIGNIRGEDISFSNGKYIYNSGLVASANILTYVDLAELFRTYWNSLNNVLDQLADFDTVTETDIPAMDEPPFTDAQGRLIALGTLGGTEFDAYSVDYTPDNSLSIPSWSGVAPTDYNQGTYPQLLDEWQRVTNLSAFSEPSLLWETNYWYSKRTDDVGSNRGALASMGKFEGNSPDNTNQYIQFYNNGTTSIDIELSIDVTALIDASLLNSISYASWAEIDDINTYPNPTGGDKTLLSSYISLSDDMPTGVGSLSTTRTVTIPPGQSAFIGARGAAFTSTTPSVGLISITIVINGFTLIHSVDVS